MTLNRALIVLLLMCPIAAQAFHMQHKYLQKLEHEELSESSRATLLGIINTCGNQTRLDDVCVLEGLERVAAEEDNQRAKKILQDYESAFNEGQFHDPECQTESHVHVNRTLGHCVLLMHFYAIDDSDLTNASQQYEICLQGGLLGLAYQGNLAAQHLLVRIFEEREMMEPATLWRNSLRHHRDRDEYELLVRCYG